MKSESWILAFAIALGACGSGAVSFPDPMTGSNSGALSADFRRTIVFIRAQTQPGQDMFLRGGLDHGAAQRLLGRSCTAQNLQCAIPLRHRNLKNATTAPWKSGEAWLDWYGRELGQTGNSHGVQAQGTPADWTSDSWPAAWGPARTVESDGYGVEPLNHYGPHLWMLDADLDCSRGYADWQGTSWFELKAFITNGPGWEADLGQQGAPYSSANHFAKCGQINVFEWGKPDATFLPISIRPMGTYTDWIQPVNDLDSLEIVIEPQNQPDAGTAYFYSHQFGYQSGPGGYIGIQSDVNGRRAIFSIWEALAADSPGTHVPFDNEGSGFTTKIDYPWVAGRQYKLVVRRGGQDASGTWWTGTITDLSTNASQLIGSILVPSARAGLSYYSITWVEFYGPLKPECSDYSYSKVTFHRPTSNAGQSRAGPGSDHVGVDVGVCRVAITRVADGSAHENGL
jgi:hypothetical protein